MAVDAINALAANGATSNTGAQGSSQATDAFGLSFESLLKIVLTQLTYQDPLKPMDNFQFVSQLAQFSQIQQGQDMVKSLEALVSAQTTSQAAGLLGKVVKVALGAATLTGEVTAVSFASGSPTIAVKTGEGSTLDNLPLGNVIQISQVEEEAD